MTTRATPARRALAGLAGVGALLLGTMLTIGLALLAIGGAIATHAFLRYRGRRLTPFTSWLAAVASSAIVLAVVFAVVAGVSHEFSPAAVRAATSEEGQRPPEPPAWLRRVAPSTAESMQRPDPATERLLESDAFVAAMMIMTGAMLVLIGGFVAGTLGWVSAVLLGYAITGRQPWLPAPPTTREPDDDWAVA